MLAFDCFQAVNLPTTSSLVAFGCTAEALVMATRLPNDYTQALPGGGNYGNVSTITDPSSGISLMLTQYVDHSVAVANYRVALMYGVAVGNSLAGQLVTSA